MKKFIAFLFVFATYWGVTLLRLDRRRCLLWLWRSSHWPVDQTIWGVLGLLTILPDGVCIAPVWVAY